MMSKMKNSLELNYFYKLVVFLDLQFFYKISLFSMKRFLEWIGIFFVQILWSMCLNFIAILIQIEIIFHVTWKVKLP